MGLIEDAKRLAKNGFTPWEDSCHLTCELCGEDGAGEEGSFPHASNCPWLAMPRIVQALEAAGRVVSIYRDLKRYEGRMDHSVDEWEALESLSEAMRDAP